MSSRNRIKFTTSWHRTWLTERNLRTITRIQNLNVVGRVLKTFIPIMNRWVLARDIGPAKWIGSVNWKVCELTLLSLCFLTHARLIVIPNGFVLIELGNCLILIELRGAD